MDWWWLSGWSLIWEVGLYLWTTLCLYMIAKKANTRGAGIAWIPLLNLVVLCWAAGRSGWWSFLLFVPLVNIVVYFDIWMTIAEVCNQESWLGALMIVPGVNLVIMGILAFAP